MLRQALVLQGFINVIYSTTKTYMYINNIENYTDCSYYNSVCDSIKCFVIYENYNIFIKIMEH